MSSLSVVFVGRSVLVTAEHPDTAKPPQLFDSYTGG
jgi:hypothetical protein